MSTLLEKAAKISAKRKFDAFYKDGGNDIQVLKPFLNETWDKHKDAFWKHVATADAPEFDFHIKLPDGLAFTRDDVRAAFVTYVDDFKNINEGAGGLFVTDDSLEDGLRTEFRVNIDWGFYHDQCLLGLKMGRAAHMKRTLSDAEKRPEWEEEVWEPKAEEEEEEEEEKGCWNVVVPAKDGKPERLIPINLAVVRKGSESVTHLSFK